MSRSGSARAARRAAAAAGAAASSTVATVASAVDSLTGAATGVDGGADGGSDGDAPDTERTRDCSPAPARPTRDRRGVPIEARRRHRSRPHDGPRRVRPRHERGPHGAALGPRPADAPAHERRAEPVRRGPARGLRRPRQGRGARHDRASRGRRAGRRASAPRPASSSGSRPRRPRATTGTSSASGTVTASWAPRWPTVTTSTSSSSRPTPSCSASRRGRCDRRAAAPAAWPASSSPPVPAPPSSASSTPHARRDRRHLGGLLGRPPGHRGRRHQGDAVCRVPREGSGYCGRALPPLPQGRGHPGARLRRQHAGPGGGRQRRRARAARGRRPPRRLRCADDRRDRPRRRAPGRRPSSTRPAGQQMSRPDTRRLDRAAEPTSAEHASTLRRRATARPPPTRARSSGTTTARAPTARPRARASSSSSSSPDRGDATRPASRTSTASSVPSSTPRTSRAGGRFMLVRRPGGHPAHDGPGTCWSRTPARRRTTRGCLTAEVDDVGDLLGLDWGALARGSRALVAGLAARVRAAGEPTLLVCTNGRRDVCCAVRGRPLAAHAARVAPGRAWEVSHTGGHRFAPTAVLLPWGQTSRASTTARPSGCSTASETGHLPAELLGPLHDRGRSGVPAASQCAESHVRERDRRDPARVRCGPGSRRRPTRGWQVIVTPRRRTPVAGPRDPASRRTHPARVVWQEGHRGAGAPRLDPRGLVLTPTVRVSSSPRLRVGLRAAPGHRVVAASAVAAGCARWCSAAAAP